MNKHKVKHHQNSDTRTGNRELHQNHRIGTVSNTITGGLNYFTRSTSPSVTDVVQTFSWLIGSHDNPLSCQ